tara:strand:- start:188526 stop:189896 length:1371 start_codon:yes stop_codon:yes gene_type:complete
LESKKYSLFTKITISFISLLVSLLCLEGGLRLAGLYVYSSQERNFVPYEEPKDYVRNRVYEKYKLGKSSGVIVAIGDSFTNAGNVKSYYSYPYFLFKLFEESSQPKSVINMGLCEDSTIRIYDRLVEFFKITPKEELKNLDKIIMLVGSADKFERYENYESDRFQTIFYDMENPTFFKELRIYKVFRHIKLVLLNKYLTEGLETGEDSFDDVNKLYSELAVKYEIGSTERPENFKELLKKMPDSFKDYSERLHLTLSTPIQLIHSLSVYQSKILTSEKKHDEAVFWLLDTALRFPVEFFNGEMDDAYYRLVQTYQIQSRYESSDIKDLLDKIISKSPEVEKFINFKEFKEMTLKWEEVDKNIQEERNKSWDKIVKLVKDNKVELVLMNYPTEYVSANETLKRVAKENQLVFIDNFEYFKPLIEKYGRSKILEDDDHFTPFGYELLAKHIFSKINQK